MGKIIPLKTSLTRLFEHIDVQTRRMLKAQGVKYKKVEIPNADGHSFTEKRWEVVFPVGTQEDTRKYNIGMTYDVWIEYLLPGGVKLTCHNDKLFVG